MQLLYFNQLGKQIKCHLKRDITMNYENTESIMSLSCSVGKLWEENKMNIYIQWFFPFKPEYRYQSLTVESLGFNVPSIL